MDVRRNAIPGMRGRINGDIEATGTRVVHGMEVTCTYYPVDRKGMLSAGRLVFPFKIDDKEIHFADRVYLNHADKEIPRQYDGSDATTDPVAQKAAIMLDVAKDMIEEVSHEQGLRLRMDAIPESVILAKAALNRQRLDSMRRFRETTGMLDD